MKWEIELTARIPRQPTACTVQVAGKIMVATTGGSPLKPSEVALLEVDSVEGLRGSTPEQWQVLQRSSKAQARLFLPNCQRMACLQSP